MIRCFNCGSENDEGTRYCNNCGALLDIPKPAEPIDDDDIPVAQAIPQAQQVQGQPVAAPVAASSAKINKDKNDPVCLWGFILSLVSIVCCGITSLFGLGLSICGFIRTNKSGQKGKTLAIAGMIISGIMVLVFIFSYISGTFNRLTNKDTDTTTTTTEEVEETSKDTKVPETKNTTETTATTESSDAETSDTSETEESTEASTEATGIRPEVKEAIDSYEEFYTEYCEFLKKYSESNYSATMLGEYMTMMSKLAEMEAAWDAIDETTLTAEEDEYYTAASLRISAKMLEAEGYMMGQL